MNYPPAIYVVKWRNKVVGLYRFGHHQSGEHAGSILTSQATPIRFRGNTLYPKHKGEKRRFFEYECYRVDMSPRKAEEAYGHQIVDMTKA